MPDTWKFLGTPEFGANVIVSLLASILAAFIVDWLKSRAFNNLLPRTLQINALLIVILAASPYSTFVGSWHMDLLMGVVFAGIYVGVSLTPSTRLQVFALFGPNLLMLVMAWAHASISGHIAWRSLVAVYPIMFVFFAVPVMIGVAIVSRRVAGEERAKEPPRNTAAV